MTNDKTKQILRLLKWQALVVSGQDNGKMDVIVQCRRTFVINMDILVRFQAFDFRVQIKKV